MPIFLSDIAAFLDEAFQVERFPDDAHGVIVPSDPPIRRIGLALEPWAGMGEWMLAEGVGALFLHRPFRLTEEELPNEVGVLASHQAFDAALTFAENPRLAVALGMRGYGIFAPKDGLPRGMIGDITQTTPEMLLARLRDIFATESHIYGTLPGNIRRIVVANALSAALVDEAAALGADCYLTGQYRPSAAHAMEETGLAVVIIGHEAGERWGLRALAGMLRERWSGLAIVIAPEETPPASSTRAL